MPYRKLAADLTEAADRAGQLITQSGAWAQMPSLFKTAAAAVQRASEPGSLPSYMPLLSNRPAYMALLAEAMRAGLGWNGRGILMGWCDAEQRCTHQNDAVCDFLGISREEACLKWNDYVHPEDRPVLWRTFNGAFLLRAPFQLYYRLRHREGDYRWIHSVVQPYTERDGSFGGYIGFGIEVAEAVQAA